MDRDDWNEDDLGVVGGDTFFDHADEVRTEVLGWQVTSVGRRPEDFIDRDLLFASMQRDGRLWMYRKMLKEEPSWTQAGLGRLAERDKRQAVKHRLLHYLHLLGLARFRDDALSREPWDPDIVRAIDRLWRCWPRGAEVQWNGDGHRSPQDLCDRARLCPFCLVRVANRLVCRITQGPLAGEPESVLLLGRLDLTDRVLHDALPNCANPFRWVREEVGKWLRQQARTYGAEGGILTYQVGPQQESFPVWRAGELTTANSQGFRYCVAILAHVCAPSDKLAQLVCERHGPEAYYLSDERITPDWTIKEANAQTTRMLLVGTSPSCSKNSEKAKWGHPGALAFQPWSLANYGQWRAHFLGTHDMQLYTPWGTWRDALESGQRRQGCRCKLVNANARLGERRRKIAFSQANQQKRYEAEDRRRNLLPRAAAMWSATAGANCRQPGRKQLRQALESDGCCLSERDARWLVKELKELESSQANR